MGCGQLPHHPISVLSAIHAMIGGNMSTSAPFALTALS
jgi:hypothetical protein